MSLIDGIKLALKGLAANKLRAFLTALGVIIGVASVVTLISIGEGVRSYISNQIQALGSNLIIVTPHKAGGLTAASLGGTVSKLTFEDAQAIESQAPAVKGVAPIIEVGSRIQFDKAKKETLVNGTSPAYPQVRNSPVEAGRFISDQDTKLRKQVVVLGHTTFKRLFKGTKEEAIGKKVKINGREYEVIGVMARKGNTLTINNDDRVFIPITTAEKHYDTSQVGLMFISARSPGQVEKAEEQVKKILLKRHKGEDFMVTEQRAILNAFRGITNTLTAMLGGIASVSLIVGGIGIMNIMLVSVMERIGEIGLRKALGARRRDILLQFLLEAIALSVGGGVIGVFLGIVASYLITQYIPYLTTVIPPWSLVVAFLFAVLVGIFFGYYPARKAALLDPLEALRYE
ncbi:ABC transporter permease [Calderihabitans maritimus]|uniref:Uncharacterized protein n=1 Tax=Calderihabitans maritimus TaxID=1246530 RepID=A0A1Z5HP49_9FIRM|nr:ABC transporter permease [Calderihabitans maritimus]GAW91157.1 hypothetical protein BBR47_15080 [Calderihabitans maritimus]